MPGHAVFKRKRSGAMGTRKRARSSYRLPLARNMSIGRPVDRLNSAGGLRNVKKISSTGNIYLIPSTGFVYSGAPIASGYTLAFAITQSGILVYQPTVGGAALAGFTYSDYASFNTIFDEFRINKVTVNGYFSNNTSSVSNSTTAMPLFYSAIDFDGDGSTATTTAVSVLEYENSKVHKAGSGSAPFMRRTFIPRITNNATGNIITSNNYTLLPEKSWVNSASYGAPHWGMVIGYDPQGSTATYDIGCVTFVFEVEYEYRGNR